MPHARVGDELLSRRYTVEELPLNGGYKQYINPNGKVAITKSKYYDYPFLSGMTKNISRNKELSYAFAQLYNVTVPATIRTVNFDEASKFLATHGRVIVKPTELGGSYGLTLDITHPSQLREAIVKATINGSSPLIQEQFIGEEVRFTVIGGKVQSVVLRETPRVIGDGKKTVAELIQAENEVRKTLVFPLFSYPPLTAEIIPGHFINDTTVLAESEILELSKTTTRHGASFYGVLETIHPSYIEIVERLASRLNPPFLVLDLMVKDLNAEAQPNNYIFLEFNTAPALVVYSSIRGGDTPDVIGRIADLVDEYSQLSS